MKDKIKKIGVFICSLMIFLVILYPVLKLAANRIIASNYTIMGKLYGTTIMILFLFLVYVFYRYMLKILDALQDKKWKKAIFMLLPMILFIVITIFIKVNMVFQFKILCANIAYVVLAIILPLIIIGIAILDEEKNKKKYILKIIFVIGLAILIYCLHFSEMCYISKSIIETTKNNTLQDIVKTNKEVKKETIDNLVQNYLNPYAQKMEKNAYIERLDIDSITSGIKKFKDIDIKIMYTDKVQDIRLELSNQNENWRKTLSKQLEGIYYQFSYKVDGIKVNIYIEKYQAEYNTSNEKNKDITITGKVQKDIIENVQSSYENENAQNYVFDNQIKMEKQIESKQLDKFKILLVKDKTTNNFIPYGDNLKEYEKIKSYKVYSTGINITLEDNIKLENQYYTVRVNRYSDSYEADKHHSLYFYKFEPVVTQMTDWNNNIVLEIKFDGAYILKQLNNIEILFGYRE